MTSPKRYNNLEKASRAFKIIEIPTCINDFCAGAPLIGFGFIYLWWKVGVVKLAYINFTEFDLNFCRRYCPCYGSRTTNKNVHAIFPLIWCTHYYTGKEISRISWQTEILGHTHTHQESWVLVFSETLHQQGQILIAVGKFNTTLHWKLEEGNLW